VAKMAVLRSNMRSVRSLNHCLERTVIKPAAILVQLFVASLAFGPFPPFGETQICNWSVKSPRILLSHRVLRLRIRLEGLRAPRNSGSEPLMFSSCGEMIALSDISPTSAMNKKLVSGALG
jgi:hypothetical protein